jgi:UDP-N-acetylmuramate-alanine ligase
MATLPDIIDRLVHDKTARVHFVGIGGTGMSGYADFRALSGAATSGSDRGFDQGRNIPLQDGMAARGITIFPQDGSGVDGAAAVVVSAAVEADVPDYARAVQLDVPIITRAAWLAAHYRAYDCIAITGTSGKSTVTAMVFEILRGCGRDPSLMTGADLKSLLGAGRPGNTHVGTGPLVIEADESDKGIGGYTPLIGVVLNLQRDHDEPENMLPSFLAFKNNCRRACILSDDPALMPLRDGAIMVGETAPAPYTLTNIRPGYDRSVFNLGEHDFTVPVPGRHNVDNAAIAVATALSMNIPADDIARALAGYQGVARRFEVVADAGRITVVDDYAHNPAKIAAALRTAQARSARVMAYFQPTGFGPTRFLRHDLVAMFAEVLRADDFLYLAPIPYLGGTAVQDISSDDLVVDLAARGVTNAAVVPTRDEFLAAVPSLARPGDLILILGGRDATLPVFARDVAGAVTPSPLEGEGGAQGNALGG